MVASCYQKSPEVTRMNQGLPWVTKSYHDLPKVTRTNHILPRGGAICLGAHEYPLKQGLI